MNLSIRSSGGGSVVLKIEGMVDSGTAPAVLDALRRAMGMGCRRLIVDLQDVVYIDAAGFKALMDGWIQMRTRDGSLTLSSPSAAVQKVLDECRNDVLIDVHPDEQSALETRRTPIKMLSKLRFPVRLLA